MIKRPTALAAGLLVLALVGCAQPPATATKSSIGPTQTAAGPTYKACLLTDAGSVSAGSPAEQAIEGLNRAQRELGIEANSVAAESSADYAPMLQSLADEQCSMVVALGSGMANAVEAAAKANPAVEFALIDAIPNSTPTNLRPVVFNVQESGFLAGYAAAARSTSGTVGAFGALNVAPVTAYLDGFVQGVAYFNQAKDAQVQVVGWDLDTQNGTFVRSDSDPYSDASAGRVAAQTLAGQGADVIMAVAGDSGVGALQLAAETSGLKVIWTGTNGCQTQASYCDQQLGSVVKDRGTAIFELIRADQQGRGASGVFTAGLRNDGTTFVPAHDGEFGSGVGSELDALRQQIIDGSVKVSSPAAIG